MERAHARKRKDRSVVRRGSAAVPGIVADPAARRSPLHGAQGVGLSNPRHLPEKTHSEGTLSYNLVSELKEVITKLHRSYLND